MSANSRIEELEQQISELQDALKREQRYNSKCPRCGSDKYALIHVDQAGIPDQWRCFDCRFPNLNSTGNTFSTLAELVASLPQNADRYDIKIENLGNITYNDPRNHLQEGVAMNGEDRPPLIG